MAELMLVNPRKRGKKRRKYAKRRKYGKRSTPVVTTLKRRHVYMTNPKRRRKYRSYRSNPTGRFTFKGFMQHTLMPSTIGAAGALGIDVIMGFLPIPVQFKTGPIRTVVKIAGAAAIGAVAANFVKRETAQQITAGAITVALYDVFKGFLQQAMPTIPLSEADAMMQEYPSLSYAGAGYTVDEMSAVDAYVSDGDETVGMYVGE